MTIKKGAVAIDTKLNTEKIVGDFKNLEKSTKHLIDKYNRSVDSIKSQELAIQKVKDQIETLQMYQGTGVIKESETQKLSELIERLPLLESKLSQTKEEANDVKDSIKDAFKEQNLKGFKAGIDDVGKKIDKFKNRVSRLIGTAMVFSLLRSSLNSLRTGFISLLKSNDTFSNSLNQIKANLMTAFAPIYNACLPAINSLMNALSKLTGTIAIFISGLFGKSLKDAQKDAKGLSKALDKTANSGEKASGSLASFDKLEVIQDNSSGGSSGGSGIDYSKDIQYSQTLLNFLNKIKEFVTTNKELIIGLLFGVASGLLAIKFGCEALEALGIGILIAGIIMLIQSVIAYLNDPSFENFGKIITSIGLIVLGFGVILGGIPAIIAGICIAIVGLIASNWETIKGGLQNAINWIDSKMDWIKTNFGAIGVWIAECFKGAINMVLSLFDGLFTGTKQVLDGIIKIFKGDFKGGLTSVAKGIGNALIGIANTIIDGINAIVTPIRGLIVAAGKVLGKKWTMDNIKIPRIPKLATGAVLPPRHEFAAILGDQKHGTNIETPASLMADIFDERLNKFFSKFESLSNDVKEIVFRNLTIVAQFGNRDFQKLVIDAVRLSEKELGRPLFVN